ncbi:MAG: endonuclease III [Bacteroidales bacterium]|nr:endonuclease III [Bacteroidales bacterium]
MRKEDRFKTVIAYFLDHQPDADTELRYRDPYELTVAVILSAQCTDKRVNIITPAFFERFPTPESLSKASQEQVFSLIKSCSYPNNKAKNLIGMANALMGKFNGILPSDIDLLQTIPGIGRKTANVLASVIYHKPTLAVDTHVFRVADRLGLTTGAKNPLQTEKQLVRYIPEKLRGIAHHWLILHGRYICIARRPKCSSCGLIGCCRYYQDFKKKSVVNNSTTSKGNKLKEKSTFDR